MVIILLWRFLLLLSYYTVLLNNNNVIIGSFPIHNFVLHYTTIIIIYNFITSLIPYYSCRCCYYCFRFLRFYLRRWRRRDLDYLQIIVLSLMLLTLQYDLLLAGLTIGHNHTGSVRLRHDRTATIPLNTPSFFVLFIFLGQQNHLLLVLFLLVLLLLRVPLIHHFLE